MMHAPWIYPNFVEISMMRIYYPHFTEISTLRGYWTLVRMFPASIDSRDVYWYVPQSYLVRRRHGLLCSGFEACRRHSL